MNRTIIPFLLSLFVGMECSMAQVPDAKKDDFLKSKTSKLRISKRLQRQKIYF